MFCLVPNASQSSLYDSLLIEGYFPASVKRLRVIEVAVIQALVDDDAIAQDVIPAKRKRLANSHGGKTISVTIVFAGSGSHSIRALICGYLSNTVRFTAFFFGSFTPIAGFRSIFLHTTACARRARNAACIFLIV